MKLWHEAQWLTVPGVRGPSGERNCWEIILFPSGSGAVILSGQISTSVAWVTALAVSTGMELSAKESKIPQRSSWKYLGKGMGALDVSFHHQNLRQKDICQLPLSCLPVKKASLVLPTHWNRHGFACPSYGHFPIFSKCKWIYFFFPPAWRGVQFGVGKELAFWSLKERLGFKLLVSYLGKLLHPLDFWPFFYECKEVMALLCGNSEDCVRRGLTVTLLMSPPPSVSALLWLFYILCLQNL